MSISSRLCAPPLLGPPIVAPSKVGTGAGAAATAGAAAASGAAAVAAGAAAAAAGTAAGAATSPPLRTGVSGVAMAGAGEMEGVEGPERRGEGLTRGLGLGLTWAFFLMQ